MEKMGAPLRGSDRSRNGGNRGLGWGVRTRRGTRPGPRGAEVTPPVPSLLRVCSVRSVDGSPTTAFTVLECEGSRRLGSRPRRYLLTGQANGSLAMWDLTTAMDGLGQAPGTPSPKPHALTLSPLLNLLCRDLPPQTLAL